MQRNAQEAKCPQTEGYHAQLSKALEKFCEKTKAMLKNRNLCRHYCRQHTGFITGVWVHTLHGRHILQGEKTLQVQHTQRTVREYTITGYAATPGKP